MSLPKSILLTIAFHSALTDYVHADDHLLRRRNTPSSTNHSDSDMKLGARPGTEDKTIYEGLWGDWKGWYGENEGGYYACGGEMRFEKYQGAGAVDDSAGNGLRLTYCHLQNWSTQRVETIYNGLWGDWKGMQMCPFGYYVDGGRVRFEPKQYSGDDTALNGLMLRCRSHGKGDIEWITVYEGLYGNWMVDVEIPDKYVTLANIRFEDNQQGADDSAWNGLKFRYETPNYGISLAPVYGKWDNVASGPSVSTTITESIESINGQTLTDENRNSISATIGGGYKFLDFEVTGEHSESTAQSVSSTIKQKETRSIKVSCTGTSPTGEWVLWQWVMNQDNDSTGSGMNMQSNQYRCTTQTYQAPKCPLGMCVDKYCQTCTGPIIVDEAKEDKMNVDGNKKEE